MTTIAPYVPFNEKTELFDPENPRAKKAELDSMIDGLFSLPFAVRSRLHELTSEATMEAWTRGYRSASNVID